MSIMFKRSHFGGGLFAYEATLSNGNVAVWYPDGAFEDGDGVTAELLTFAKEDATYEHPLTRRHCRSLEDAQGYLENKETGFSEYVVAAIHCANASRPASNERSREAYQDMPHISIPPTKEEVANWILWNDSNAEVDPQDTLDDYLHTLILMTDESNQ